MVFHNLHIPVLWTKVASALAGLISNYQGTIWRMPGFPVRYIFPLHLFLYVGHVDSSYLEHILRYLSLTLMLLVANLAITK